MRKNENKQTFFNEVRGESYKLQAKNESIESLIRRK